MSIVDETAVDETAVDETALHMYASYSTGGGAILRYCKVQVVDLSDKVPSLQSLIYHMHFMFKWGYLWKLTIVCHIAHILTIYYCANIYTNANFKRMWY